MPESQACQILRYLRAGNTLTPLDALRLFGCLRLGARIWDLRQAGYPITEETVTLPNGKRVGRYSYDCRAARRNAPARQSTLFA